MRWLGSVRCQAHRFGAIRLGRTQSANPSLFKKPRLPTQGRHVSTQSVPTSKKCFIALGSNLGDRLANTNHACKLLEQIPHINLLRTSSLYETAPWGHVVDQPTFLNGVAEIETNLDPHTLLDALQDIENRLHRLRSQRWGSRTLDLDILLYGRETVQSDRLTVPHASMTLREFVLRPLCDLAPDLVLPEQSVTISAMLGALPVDPTMTSSFALTPTNQIAMDRPDRPCQVMSILNVTPDSFSDGGNHLTKDIAETIGLHIKQGATIIDIGGQSSRPGAESITAETELSRVLPAIEAARHVIQETKRDDVAISVDTYRAPVARKALEAGAHLINDISAGRLDADMLPTVAEFGGNIVLMHMRGTPTTMSKEPHTLYPDGLIETIASELGASVERAQNAGIRRWQIMLDPGIGFAKTQAQNLEILRRLADLRAMPVLQNLPWILGASRKKFIGSITGVADASRRDWGTAATVAAAVQGGADVVRVHAVDEMAAVAKMSTAIWRP